MGEILPFMELEGYKRLKEMEDANRKLRHEKESLETKLKTETLLRQLYENLAQKRLRKIVDLEEHLQNGNEESGSKAVEGHGQTDQTTTSVSEGDRSK